VTLLPLEALPIDVLRQRSSTKWRRYPDDVLPLFVAETDFPLAPAITARLARAVEIGDTGYTPPEPGIAEAFRGFAARHWDWDVPRNRIFWTGDVMMGVVEVLRRVVAPGERVVVMPPVYPPFFDTVEEAGAVVERVPLARTSDGWEIDLEGVGAALAAGARAVLLCNPHNPTGTVHTRESLAALVRSFPWEVEWRTGLFGALANVAAFSPESDEWLARLRLTLDLNRVLVADVLASHLPDAVYRVPQAGYLAWIDVSAYGWGDNPAVRIRREARVALHHGPLFGDEGIGHVRLNFGCAPEVIEEAIARVGALVTR
jgi:bifunctional pyridoxal-dependent enzyme with beta-cystathionase and maltose regulon repressor activities